MPNIHVFYLLKRSEKILIALNGRCTLYLSGILACQKAIMIGIVTQQNNAVDKYDINHNLSNFDDHVTVPLGVAAKTILKGLGYQVRFSHYPIIQHPDDLNFAALSQSLTNPINL